MEILFLYLGTSEIFKEDLQLNFGGQHLFHYDKEAQQLTVRKNPYFIEGFFDINNSNESASIKLVTGVIGENGAGKSSIIYAIRNVFTRGLHGIRFPVVIALINQRNEKVVYHFDVFPIVKGNYAEAGFLKVEIKNKKQIHKSKAGFNVQTENPPEIDEVEFLDLIYFSNVFDGGLEFEFDGLRNISTNFLIRNEVVKNLEYKLISPSDLHREVEQFLFEDISRQVDFVNNFEYPEVLPFDIPDRLIISPKRDFLDVALPNSQFRKSSLDYSTEEIINELISLFAASIEKLDSLSLRAEYYIAANCFLNFIYEVRDTFNYGLGTEVLNYFREAVNKNDNVVNIKSFIIKITNAFREEFKDDNFRKCAEGIVDFCSKVNRFINPEFVSNETGRTFFLDIENINIFREFYELYTRSFILRPFLNFTWRNLSSGERAMFNIYSRFYSLTNKLQKAENARLRDNILIMIDEGDLYLHPAWQKRFLFDLLKFLPSIYATANDGAKRNLQIIITSNNPISVSDLPNPNLVFLEKKNNTIKVADGLDEKKLTFAANIHTLYTDSFFLKGGLVGEFAKMKINRAIEILQGDRGTIITNREHLEIFISSIGEQLIKSKLTQMLSERLQLNLIDLQERVANLENELSELRNNLKL